MWKLELYELKKALFKASRRVHPPFFTAFGWGVILGVAFAAGLAAGIGIAVWTLETRGLIG